MMPEHARSHSGNLNCSGNDMRHDTPAAHALFLAALLCAAPAANAVMYKWIDETGSVTYSNAPPADPQKAHNVTTIGDISPDLGRREQALEAERGSAGAKAASSSPVGVSATPAAGSHAAYGHARDDASHREAGASAQPPRASGSRLRAEAVRDPCLRSSDPQCHQRNQGKYDPYLGYAPSTLAPPAVGSTPGAGASGELGGRITITPGR